MSLALFTFAVLAAVVLFIVVFNWTLRLIDDAIREMRGRDL